MANQQRFFMAPEDEVALFRFLERFDLEVYPRRVPPDWQSFRAGEDTVPRLPEEELYLVASSIGPAVVDKIKKGPDKGFWRIDEVRSPVLFLERSRLDESGELLSGQLWAELEVTPQTGRRDAAPDRFRRLYREIDEYLKKTYRKSEPKGFLIGPKAARLHKESGLVLRDSKHRGGTVIPYK
jgi:hypothetical protein